ncbi:MAG: N-acetylneuraminate synthase family protein [Phycisphaerales bacterium]
MIVAEIANNHLGCLREAERLIDAVAGVSTRTSTPVAVKFQLRDLNVLLHRTLQSAHSQRYVRKIRSRSLPLDVYGDLSKRARDHGLIVAATVFDESAIDAAVNFGISILKLASADLCDYHLATHLATTRSNIVLSTGGARWTDIQAAVALLSESARTLTINHCVSLYPTPIDALRLGNISALRSHFPHATIGFSTHQPDLAIASTVRRACCLGAMTLERHIAPTRFGFAPYNSDPDQFARWSEVFRDAVGHTYDAPQVRFAGPTEAEAQYLAPTRRGLYAKKSLPPGCRLTVHNTYSAIPWLPNCLSAACLRLPLVITNHVDAHGPVSRASVGSDLCEEQAVR